MLKQKTCTDIFATENLARNPADAARNCCVAHVSCVEKEEVAGWRKKRKRNSKESFNNFREANITNTEYVGRDREASRSSREPRTYSGARFETRDRFLVMCVRNVERTLRRLFRGRILHGHTVPLLAECESFCYRSALRRAIYTVLLSKQLWIPFPCTV